MEGVLGLLGGVVECSELCTDRFGCLLEEFDP